MKAIKRYKFEPDWASSPCDTIQDILEEKNLSVSDLAQGLGISEYLTEHLYFGRIPITEDLADKLGSFFGQSPSFWVNRQRHFNQAITRLLNG